MTKPFTASLLVLGVLWPAAASAQAPAAPPTAAPTAATAPEVTPLYRDAASGVEVYDVLNDRTFPAEWQEARIAASASPIDAAERERALRLVKAALSKYPPDFLRRNLRRVHLLGSLKFRGVSAAATNSSNSLYVAVRANTPSYTDLSIEGSIHHEFGHLLQRKHRAIWAPDSWAACNPSGFQYGLANGVEAIRTGRASLKVTDDWNQKGFVSEYAASSASEDFATVAGKLFLGDPDFWKRVDAFPALKAKADVAIGFYQKLDPRFNESFLRGLRVGIAPAEPVPPTDTPPQGR